MVVEEIYQIPKNTGDNCHRKIDLFKVHGNVMSGAYQSPEGPHHDIPDITVGQRNYFSIFFCTLRQSHMHNTATMGSW